MAITYTNQAPKEHAKMAKAWLDKNPDVYSLKGDRRIQPKYDGVAAKIFTAEKVALSRTDKKFKSIPHVIDDCVSYFGPDKVVFGEIWETCATHQTINGKAKRQFPQKDLVFVVFDVVTLAEYNAGYSQRSYIERVYCLTWLRGNNVHTCLYPSLVKVTSMPYKFADIPAFMNQLSKSPSAYDGVIIRDMDAPWRAGASRFGEVIKVKPKLTLKLPIVDACVEVCPTKLGGYITVLYEGKRTNVGSGLTQVGLRILLKNPAAFNGEIGEIECLGITPQGYLREPRLKSIRFDAVLSD